jgi:hypothetical protein
MRDRLWWEGLVMTQRYETIVAPVWCQAGRKLNRSPNLSMVWSAWRVVMIAVIVAVLGWSVVGAVRDGVEDVSRGLDTASAVDHGASAVV